MNFWIIAAIVIGVLGIAGVFIVSISAVNADEEIEASECTSCGNACTIDNNCGLSSCGAVNGGSCGCGR